MTQTGRKRVSGSAPAPSRPRAGVQGSARRSAPDLRSIAAPSLRRPADRRSWWNVRPVREAGMRPAGWPLAVHGLLPFARGQRHGHCGRVEGMSRPPRHGSRCDRSLPTVSRRRNGTTAPPDRFSQSRSRGWLLSRAAPSGRETGGGSQHLRPVQPGSGWRCSKRCRTGIRSRHRQQNRTAGRQLPNCVCAFRHASPHRIESLFARELRCSQRSAAPPRGIIRRK